VGDDVGHPGPLRVQEWTLDLLYLPPASLRAQAGVTQDGQVLLGRLTGQWHSPRRTVVEDDEKGLVGPPMGLVVEDG